MINSFSKEQWADMLRDPKLFSEKDLELLHYYLSLKEHKYFFRTEKKKGRNDNNFQPARVAKKIEAAKGQFNYEKRPNREPMYWTMPFRFNGPYGKVDYWQLRPEIAEALIDIEQPDDFSFAEEIPSEMPELFEGIVHRIMVNKYERDITARNECLRIYGVRCIACNMNFEEEYGSEVGRNFIHVHHKVPISTIGKSYKIDPGLDLCPVCPNCHAMLHRRRDVVLTIEELKLLIKNAEGRKAKLGNNSTVTQS